MKFRELETKVAVGISRFAGTPLFIYLHFLVFGAWLILGRGLGDSNYWLLTMAVSLEAILLSAFILLAQNRLETVIEEQAEEEDEEDKELDEDIEEIQTDLDVLRVGMDALKKTMRRVEKRLKDATGTEAEPPPPA